MKSVIDRKKRNQLISQSQRALPKDIPVGDYTTRGSVCRTKAKITKDNFELYRPIS